MVSDPFRSVYRKLEPEEQDAIARMKAIAGSLWTEIDRRPSSREAAIAKTKLEEAVMWAVKAYTG